MSGIDFVHLHLHSQYSLLDGAIRFGPLFNKLKKHNMPVAALTDHGHLFGALDFYLKGTAAGIKPIIGCEFYVAPGKRTERKTRENKSANHVVLLATNYQGYLNLVKLTSIAHLEGFYYKPRIDLEALQKYSSDLICLTGCIKGRVPELLIEGKPRKAREALVELIDIFGKENIFVEIQDHGLAEQKKANPALVKLAEESGLGLVATNDCHYLNREDAELQDVLLCIGTGKVLDEEERLRFSSNEFYVKTPEEMAKLFKELPQALKNTVRIAERCAPEIKTKQKLLPHFALPPGKNQHQYLRELVYDGLKTRYGKVTDSIKERVEMELGVIQETGFDSYFLIVWDFVRYARENDVGVGPGRGSAAGSIISYSLNITDIDPLENGLLFERFLNKERMNMPDIDIDFDDVNRDKVIQYVKDKYGEDNVAQIITFGSLMARSAVRDVGRVLNIPLGTVDRVAKMIPPNTSLTEAMKTVDDLRLVQEEDPRIKKMLQFARGIEGIPRHCSTHAAGVVISDKPLSDVVPLYQPAGTNDVATQYTMKQVEEIGLLKMDFLGLKNLSIIQDCIDRVKKTRNVEVIWDEVPLDDEKTYELLASGDTIGVFQLESEGMRNLVKRLIPNTFADITALLALYRPGPLGSGMVDDFVSRKHGRKEIIYEHPLLESILKETYGVILYQEQVMRIAQEMAGYSLGQADILRKAMGKKDPEVMNKQKAFFVEGAQERGVEKLVAEKIFDQIIYFAGYGFNKSHSAAYALITYRTAYLKAHYTVEYMASILTNEIGKKDKIAYYIGVCKESGLPVLPPDVNESFSTFTAAKDKVRFGLAGIRNVGAAAVDKIIEERKENGPFKSFQDFVMRVPSSALNSRLLESLIKSGAFDSLGVYRSQLMQIMPETLEMGAHYQKEKNSAQGSLFDLMGGSGPSGPSYQDIPLPHVTPWSEKERLQYEKHYLGFYVTGHPLNGYRVDLHSLATADTRSMKEKKDNHEICLVGIITSIKPKLDRKGNSYAHVMIEDFQGSCRLIFFNRSYQKYKPLLEVEKPIYVKGRVQRARKNEPEVIVNEVAHPAEARQNCARRAEFAFRPESATRENLEKLKDMIGRHKGKLPVFISLKRTGVERISLAVNKKMKVNPSDDLIKDIHELPFPCQLTFSTET